MTVTIRNDSSSVFTTCAAAEAATSSAMAPARLARRIMLSTARPTGSTSPACMRSNASLMRSSGIVWVMRSSMLMRLSMYQSTIFGTSVRPRAPPNAVPCHTRPVTSWNGRVRISWPAPATPMIVDTPQPRWQHSSAWRMRSTLPTHSKL